MVSKSEKENTNIKYQNLDFVKEIPIIAIVRANPHPPPPPEKPYTRLFFMVHEF